MFKSNKLAMRGGSYSLVLTAIVLAILVVVNILASALPTSMTRYDISQAKLYSITSNTKAVVNNLQKDVTIYWIVQSGSEDNVIETLLGKYDSLSDHVSVVKKNPDVYPTFAQQYTSGTVNNNSLVVESGDRYRYIDYNDIYVTSTDMYSYTYTTSFDGEGAITSAIDYVISDELPQLYTLSGHGETDLPATFSDQISKENMEVSSISLLNIDSIPEDCACLIIYAPQSDISLEEKNMLADYVSDGGKLMVIASPVDGVALTNLNSILSDYCVSVNEGIVIDSDRNHYAFERPYILMPDLESSDITDSLITENYYPILPVASGLTIETNSDNVTSLLTTSDDSFSKLAGYDITTYDFEDGDINGPFSLAVSIDSSAGGQIVWFSSSMFLEDTYNSYSSGANTNLAMNALSSLVGESDALSIRSKSLNYNYLTISEAQGSMLKAVMLVLLPVTYLGIGVVIFVMTRRKQRETN